MKTLLPLIALACGLAAPLGHAAEDQIVEHNLMMDHGDGHLMDMDGAMVMGQNKDKLPGGCDKISEDKQITVRAGHKYAKKFPGTMFAFDQQEFRFKPCTRLTVNFINEDHIRHQWMMHGLPKFLYDKGMFHLEVTGPGKVSGTLILPREDRTYLVHCDIAQHMEKGMKAQLIVGNGGPAFPSIPGVTDLAIPDHYGPPAQATAVTDGQAGPAAAPTPPTATGTAVVKEEGGSLLSGSMVFGILIGLFGAPYAIRVSRKHLAGLSAGDVVHLAEAYARRAADVIIVAAEWLIKRIRQQFRAHSP